MSTKAMSSVSIIPFESLHVSTPTWWLESRFHFSFADYWDPKRNNFGCLRVMNDDYIKGEAGFGTHPHRDMEIFTYVADGELSHGDSMGNMQTLVTGDVQYLSAGTGITHSEMNRSKKTAHIIQTWLIPDRKGHTPQYGQTSYQPSDRADRLLHIISGTKSAPEWPNVYSPSAIALHQDVNVYVSQSRAGTTFDLSLAEGRQSYLLCIEGSLSVNGTKLRGKDAAKVLSNDASPTSLKLEAGEPNAHFMLIEMAKAD
eukprot:CAMPEP_0175040976 /NCGR_PEP_ID=MMETSP0052_2-20121109/1624_1 /TAXON_ID=51329 ORGANISM="Polytomella parva, Strain SAG 63-3" /NCGR_SAMPLE_ID=MMETSP0052_2 /ASSEMBLY_ACC=CAM_ASM_000194 /LENGTH=256 /DNA_ID=CAMNT_0016303371 /DNA_START=81 /DNA_END=851 /DNA_ORIENTATION=-